MALKWVSRLYAAHNDFVNTGPVYTYLTCWLFTGLNVHGPCTRSHALTVVSHLHRAVARGNGLRVQQHPVEPHSGHPLTPPDPARAAPLTDVLLHPDCLFLVHRWRHHIDGLLLVSTSSSRVASFCQCCICLINCLLHLLVAHPGGTR
jgi:hypothetical protein